MARPSDAVLEVRDLQVRVSGDEGDANAVDGVSFSVSAGETLAIVGESGSGKSMTALSLMGLHPAPAARIVGGDVLLNGRSIIGLTDREWSQIRGNEIGLILQDPLTALNPLFPIGDQVAEGPRLHQDLRGKKLQNRVVDLLDAVRVDRPRERLHDFPHQFSGGMRQRVVGAIGISCSPTVLIADEPTTSLDVTVERSYLELLQRLQEDTGVAIIFITHDFGVVDSVADRIAVMYSGRIIETGPTEQLLSSPAHPYTQGLVASVPDIERPPPSRLPSIPGSPPSLFGTKPACHFAPRCSYVMDQCMSDAPPPVQVNSEVVARCWRHAG